MPTNQDKKEGVLKYCLCWLLVLGLSAPLAHAKPPKKAKTGKPQALLVEEIEKPVRFDESITTIPDDFYAATPDRFVRWIKSVQDAAGKVDEFTSAEERARQAQTVQSALEETGNLTPFLYNCYKKYVPEKQRFEFYDYLDEFPAGSPLSKYEGSYYRIDLLRDDNHLRSYIGRNAYGAQVDVVETLRKYVSLAFKYQDAPQSLFTEPPSRFLNPSFKFNLEMSSSEAREQVDQIGCLILFKVTPGYLTPFSDSKTPTIDSPSDLTIKGMAIVGKVDQVWVYNKMTGKVFLKFK